MVCRENLQRASGHEDATCPPPPLETPGFPREERPRDGMR